MYVVVSGAPTQAFTPSSRPTLMMGRPRTWPASRFVSQSVQPIGLR
jgi:hypothetical protein